MKKSLLFVFLSLFTPYLFSQLYTPIDTANLSVRTQASEDYLKNEKLFLKSLKTDFGGGEHSYMKKRYKAIDKVFSEDILKGQYLFNTPYNKMVDEIVSEIVSKNPTIPADLKFYISRNVPLNAASLGNKCFVINLGVFVYAQNEAQIASIIAHEIGHYMLKHSLLDIQHSYQRSKSDELEDEVYEIKLEKNNRGDKAYNKLKQILYQDANLDKKQEFEADSIGYVIYKNSKFQQLNYLSALKLEAEYDTLKPAGLDTAIYKKVFNFPNLPFRKEWLVQEDFSTYDYSKYKEKYDEDSISSHPATTERIDYLRKIFSDLNSTDKLQTANKDFLQLQKDAQFEQSPCLMFLEEYGIGSYFCLIYLQENEDDTFHKLWLGKFFRKIYDARKSYTLNRYLERVEPKTQSESYRQFLNFMWNLNLNEIKLIADHYEATPSS